MDILDLTILSLHAVAIIIGLTFKSLKTTPYITGTVTTGVSFMLYIIIADGGPGGSLGTHGSWYLLYSFFTLGALPLLTLGSAFWSGRFFSTIIRS